MGYWHGKVAIVTGASSGLGRSIALALGAAGAKVVVAARSVEALEETASRMRKANQEVLVVPTDVTQQASVDALFEKTLATYGRLDVLVNNAGRSMRRATLDTTPEDFRDLLDLNLVSVVRTTRAAAPHLLRTRGHVVNIGSLAGKSAARYLGAYPVSKFALSGYSQQLRMELGPQGLHVLLVCTGPIVRDEPRNAEREVATSAELAALPAKASKPGGGLRMRSIRPDNLAEKILRACENRRPEIVFPPISRLYFAVMQLWPGLGDFILRKMT